jgi:hypothetical protein
VLGKHRNPGAACFDPLVAGFEIQQPVLSLVNFFASEQSGSLCPVVNMQGCLITAPPVAAFGD